MIEQKEELFTDTNLQKVEKALKLHLAAEGYDNFLSQLKGGLKSQSLYFWFNRLLEIQDEHDALHAIDPTHTTDLFKTESAEIQAHEDECVQKIIKLVTLENQDSATGEFLLEVRAGTGGDEASIFAKELFDAYVKYIAGQAISYEIMSCSRSDEGYKNVVLRAHDLDTYNKIKLENGIHRVQRIPKTEAKGRVHTSTVAVAVLPVTKSTISLKAEDLIIKTCRSSGAGGQHTNTTDSAVRILHVPTGLKSECQTNRCQHKNKSKALEVLKTKVKCFYEEQKAKAQSNTKRSIVGTGERNEKRRTYNFPQNRITDHITGVTTKRMIEFFNGNIDLFNPKE